MGVTSGLLGAVSLGGSLASAFGSYQQGKAEQEQAEINAQIYEKQAQNIKEAQKISARQFRTSANVLRGQAITTAARNGVRVSGTTANSISQSIMQLQMDNSYQQFNLEVEKHNAYSNAILQRYQGKMARANGLMKAGSTALTAGSDYLSTYWKGSGNSPLTFAKGLKNKITSRGVKLSGYNDVSNNAIISGGNMFA